MHLKGLILALTINTIIWQPRLTWGLPLAEDIPEEVLRTEVILEGRSPIDGKPLTANEYEELQAQLAQSLHQTELEPDIQQLIFLLQIRKFIKNIVPFF